MTKDEMKNRISMALKDPILQQGFEIICKEIAELKEQQFSLRNERNTFLAQNEQYEKDLIDINENLTKTKELLKKADIGSLETKEELRRTKLRLMMAESIIKDLLLMSKVEHLEERYESVEEAEQFFSEMEK